MSIIKGATSSVVAAFCDGPATLETTGPLIKSTGGALSRSPETKTVIARWSAYTESLRTLGLPDNDKVASIADPGFAPAEGDVLTMTGDRVRIGAVVRSPKGGVYYVSGSVEADNA